MQPLSRRQHMSSNTRRRFFQDAAVLGVGLFGAAPDLGAQANPSTAFAAHPHRASAPHVSEPTPSPGPPMITPDVPDLPHELDGTTKVFKLTAEPVKRKIAPFKTIDCWGYN